jgi:hypothetical protein
MRAALKNLEHYFLRFSIVRRMRAALKESVISSSATKECSPHACGFVEGGCGYLFICNLKRLEIVLKNMEIPGG